MKLLFGLFLGAIFLGLGTLSYGYYEATSDPIARTASIKVENWPADKPPIRVLLMADIQMAGPDMTPERLRDIVKKANAHKPDIILIAGDFISEKRLATKLYSADETIAPLADLEAKMGIFAVLGNHDHWAGEAGFIKALKKYDIRLLQNEALAIGGINLIGIDDDYTGHHDIAAAAQSLAKLDPAPKIVLSHGPDIIPDLPFRTALIGAGHTHCGQISPPLIGPLTTLSRYGDRFACGFIKDGGHNIVVTAGLGTSILPLRIGAPPDYWVITLGGNSR